MSCFNIKHKNTFIDNACMHAKTFLVTSIFYVQFSKQILWMQVDMQTCGTIPTSLYQLRFRNSCIYTYTWPLRAVAAVYYIRTTVWENLTQFLCIYNCYKNCKMWFSVSWSFWWLHNIETKSLPLFDVHFLLHVLTLIFPCVNVNLLRGF